MQIKRQDLVKSLDTVRKFIRKDSVSPVWSTVLIDGEQQKIIAQNREARAEIDLEILDSYKQIIVPHEAEFPDEKFFVELLELNQDQLRNLCDDYGIPYLSNPAPIDMVQEVWKASMIGADEEGDSKKIWIHEKFAINPIKLRKIVTSLDMGNDDLVELQLESYEENHNVIDDEKFLPYKVRVGRHFQELPVQSVTEFPTLVYLDTTQSYSKVAEFAGKELAHLVTASKDTGDLPYEEMVLFDRNNDTVVSCDGLRVHTISKSMAGNSQIKIMTHILRQLKGKKVEMLSDDAAQIALFKTGNLSVTTEHVVQKFPNYKNKLNTPFQHTVTTDAISLERFIKQALVLTGKHYRAVELSFDDGQMSVILKNPADGTYENSAIDLITGTVSPAEKFKMDALWVEHALKPKSGVHSWVDISFDSGGSLLKFTQGDCTSLIVTMR